MSSGKGKNRKTTFWAHTHEERIALAAVEEQWREAGGTFLTSNGWGIPAPRLDSMWKKGLVVKSFVDVPRWAATNPAHWPKAERKEDRSV